MAFKMKGSPYGAKSSGGYDMKPRMSKNFDKSGMKNADGSDVKPGAPGFGRILKGVLSGGMSEIKRARDKKKKAAAAAAAAKPAVDPNAVDPNAPATGAAPVDPDLAAGPVAPAAAAPVAEDPAAAPAPTMMRGAPMYGKKKGAPKLKGNQHKIDKNKDGKISKADFNMMNK